MTTTSPHPATLTIPVSGMTCAACSGRVQRTLEKTEGVNSANVNLMTGAATVEFDPDATSPERLVDAIRSTGYGAELPASGARSEDLLETQDLARAAEVRDLRRKFGVSMVVAVLAMVFSMPLAEMTGSGAMADPLMRLMMPLNDVLLRAFPPLGEVSADGWRWTLLALTLPLVGWAGRHFYSRAWAAFRHHSADM
ncbi:MAG: cation-translocating P-type ATPase, partial [Gemmatimonadales bacterium]|nr:cation-translocating P-type ATPase [Gemmatimonadales bacterium]